jgi:hypothetical protein
MTNVYFVKITEVALIFFPRQKFRINFDPKMDWATFWAIFSPTHLVTLLASDTKTKSCFVSSSPKPTDMVIAMHSDVEIGNFGRNLFAQKSFSFRKEDQIFVYEQMLPKQVISTYFS